MIKKSRFEKLSVRAQYGLLAEGLTSTRTIRKLGAAGVLQRLPNIGMKYCREIATVYDFEVVEPRAKALAADSK